MSKLFTVNCMIPGRLGEYIWWGSNNSLLDADIVLFQPSRGSTSWNNTLLDVLRAGKTVFYLLTKEVLTEQYHGTCLPFPTLAILSEGTDMRLCSGSSPLLTDYWSEFAKDSYYEVYLERYSGFEPLVTTRGGEHVVGGTYFGTPDGHLIALPTIEMIKDPFVVVNGYGEAEVDENEEYLWTSEGRAWGKRYYEALQAIDKRIRSQAPATLVPAWVHADRFMNKEESRLTNEVAQVDCHIASLEKKRKGLTEKLDEAGRIKGLLYEQGTPLEDIVAQALELLGFEVQKRLEGASEIDFILECDEGRCVGEVEGKDKRPIHIDKLQQLAVNVRVDLIQAKLFEEAKPVLVGNAFRLQAPEERPSEHFTEKCVELAKVTGIALIRTCDLYEVARAMFESPNPTFAASCRRAILETSGEVVCFPTPDEST